MRGGNEMRKFLEWFVFCLALVGIIQGIVIFYLNIGEKTLMLTSNQLAFVAGWFIIGLLGITAHFLLDKK